MAANVRKVPFPDWLARTECVVCFDKENLSEDGERLKSEPVKKKCIWSECSKRVNDKDGKKIEVTGTVIIKGDIAPKMKEISSGRVIINNKEYAISSTSRPCNPDGTVHHTELNLI